MMVDFYIVFLWFRSKIVRVTMKIFNTLLNQNVDFKPDKLVKIYVCGITPYSSAHLGHIFTFMTYDLLQRRLEDLGHDVRMVRNITDVDEPLYIKANELKINYLQLAEQEIASFNQNLTKLNFRPVYAEPRASQYIDKIVEANKIISKNGFSYKLNDDLYFEASKTHAFGELLNQDMKLKLKLLKMRGGNPELTSKHNALDFLLWKGIKDANDPARWPSSIGIGRPGWHIECTVMSRDILGETFDLHGGGADLIFPHHESEIAQSMALNGKRPTDTWMHVYPLLLNGEKMSKSLGNMIFAHDILKKYRPSVLRLALMNYHYRVGGEWQNSFLENANQLYDKLLQSQNKATEDEANQLLDSVRLALDSDLNTPKILSALERLTKTINQNRLQTKVQPSLVKALDILGINL